MENGQLLLLTAHETLHKVSLFSQDRPLLASFGSLFTKFRDPLSQLTQAEPMSVVFITHFTFSRREWTPHIPTLAEPI